MRNKFLGITAVFALGTFASAQIVMDQLDFDNATQNSTNASQDFEAAFNSMDVATVDDFTVTAAQLRIIKVDAIMSGWNGFRFSNFSNPNIITGWRVEFYTSAAAATSNLTGNAGSVLLPHGAATVTDMLFVGDFASAGLVELEVDVTLPRAGTYWVAVMAVMNFGTGGQLGVMGTDLTGLPGNQNGGIANPGGGFGMPGNYQDGLGDPPRPADAEYRINAVPEPASMIALGIGIAALVARRRRKKAA